MDYDLLAGLSQEDTQGKRLGGGKTPVTATVTSSGDTTVHTPASGKAITLFWVAAINNPAADSAPLIIIKIGTQELYRAYALSHWEPFTGDVDAPLIVNLSQAGEVAFTAHITETTP